MIDLKTACQNILSKYPNKYIHVVNEFDNVYGFILLNKEEKINECTGIFKITAMDKQTGQIMDDLLGFEAIFEGDYKQYTQKELERIL